MASVLLLVGRPLAHARPLAPFARTRTGAASALSCLATFARGGASDVNAVPTPTFRAFVAVGSNLGDAYGNIRKGLELLQTHHSDTLPSTLPSVRIVRTSYLRETSPMYKMDQPSFLNGMVEIETSLSPQDLLKRIKSVEKDLGRDFNAERNGPRPLDLDIISYGNGDGRSSSSIIVNDPDLRVPHVGMAEREFVLAPFCDIDPAVTHPVEKVTIGEMLSRLMLTSNDVPAVRVLPLPRGRLLRFSETIVMGILNVTPDSFSDGGRLEGSAELAAEQALEMVKDGAGIIDIGGESTRPGADEVAVHEELQRTVPVIEMIRKVSDVPISIDTRNAAVAKAAIDAGADIVNDVSGGTHDPDMLRTVAELGVPMVLMHMRGTPKTMQDMTEYSDVVKDVASALLERSVDAEVAGIPRWMQILDPGIGFAKDFEDNLRLLKHTGRLRQLVGAFPILLGPSRKGFIGTISGETNPKERDFGTAAACVVGSIGLSSGGEEGCAILRVHNVRGVKQAAQVMDSVRRLG